MVRRNRRDDRRWPPTHLSNDDTLRRSARARKLAIRADMYMFTHEAVQPDNPHYNPTLLLDTLMQLLGARNDRQLATRLDVNP
jgi:hypothetical protein